MSILEIIIIAVGLAMDAFAVAVCKGLSFSDFKDISYKGNSPTAKKYGNKIRRSSLVMSIVVATYFGGFQGIMPAIGYIAGNRFLGVIEAYDHWIAFALLLMIGLKMIYESRSGESTCGASIRPLVMLPAAIATSIDALALGISLAALKADILLSSITIAITTFLLSILGVQAGIRFGIKYKSKAELTGGLVLIAIGTKILISHLISHGGI